MECLLQQLLSPLQKSFPTNRSTFPHCPGLTEPAQHTTTTRAIGPGFSGGTARDWSHHCQVSEHSGHV